MRDLVALTCIVLAGAIGLNLVRIADLLADLPIPAEFKSVGWVVAVLVMIGLVVGASATQRRRRRR